MTKKPYKIKAPYFMDRYKTPTTLLIKIKDIVPNLNRYFLRNALSYIKE